MTHRAQRLFAGTEHDNVVALSRTLVKTPYDLPRLEAAEVALGGEEKDVHGQVRRLASNRFQEDVANGLEPFQNQTPMLVAGVGEKFKVGRGQP